MSENNTTTNEAVSLESKEQFPNLAKEYKNGEKVTTDEKGRMHKQKMSSISDLDPNPQIKDHYSVDDILKILDKYKGIKANLATHVVALRDYVRTTRCVYGLNDNYDLRLFSKRSKREIRKVVDELINLGWQCWGSSKQFYSLTKGLNDLIPTASLNIDLGSDNVIYMVVGDYEAMVEVLGVFNNWMNEEKTTYDFITSGSGGDYNCDEVELTSSSFHSIHRDLYPTLQNYNYDGPEDLIKTYLESDECILLLIGPPGTGKTTITAAIASAACEHYRIVVCSDATLLATAPRAITRHINRFAENDQPVLVIVEDADSILKNSRQDGNHFINDLLNVSDGWGPTRNTDIKLIFTSNLLSTKRVDAALLRPRRCFGSFFIGLYDIEQAKRAAAVIGSDWKPSPNKKWYSLADVASYNSRRVMDSSVDDTNVGFSDRVDPDMIRYLQEIEDARSAIEESENNHNGSSGNTSSVNETDNDGEPSHDGFDI